jgi:excinuclease ABC subunit A
LSTELASTVGPNSNTGPGFIEVIGAAEHNLQNVCIKIPKAQLVAFTGVSGSGKSSLIFSTVYAESFRRFSDASQVPVHLMGRSSLAQSRRPRVAAIRGLPPALGLSQRQGVAGRLSTVGTVSGVADLLRVYAAAFGQVFCRNCDIPLAALKFDDVVAAVRQRFLDTKVMIFAPVAEKRKGAFVEELERFRKLGYTRIRLNGQLHRLDSPEEGPRLDARKLNTVELLVDAFALKEERMARAERAIGQAIELAQLVRVETADGARSEIYNLSAACPSCGESAPSLDPRHLSHSSLGQCPACEGSGGSEDGVPADLAPCTSCSGSRLASDLPTVRIAGVSFREAVMYRLSDTQRLVSNEIKSGGKDRARMRVLGELERLLAVQVDLGLGHLTLNRSGGTLSPGDLQRLRLASLLANKLRGAVYVLDEPCQGLTALETKSLLSYLRQFVENQSTVLVVEHHPDFLKGTDSVFVMGPGAGSRGGRVVLECSGASYDPAIEVSEYEKNVRRKVKPLLKEKAPIKGQKALGEGRTTLRFRKSQVRSLNLPEVTIQSHAINIIRGSSGSGKTSFVELCVLPLLRDAEALRFSSGRWRGKYGAAQSTGSLSVRGIIEIRPGSLVRSTRRSVASALDILVPLRARFESLASSQLLGLNASDFSWSAKSGGCLTCEGKGYQEFEQKYAPPLRVECTACQGLRLKPSSLKPQLRGKNFAEVLALSVEAAAEFFSNDRQIRSRLEPALEFGLGYVRLDQTMETLSGGETQRLILTLDLKRTKVEGMWYLLTHPGTGLHLPDIQVLGSLLKGLVAKGATFILIENREEFAEFADCQIQF